MKGKHFYVLGSILGVFALIFVISSGCSKEEPGVPTVPNPDAGPAKLISEIQITQNAFEPSLSIKEVGVADPETGELLSPEATEITSGITYTIVGGSCTATNLAGQWQTCCQVNITNGTGGPISSVILLGDAAISGGPSAYRTANSGTGFDGGGTGWGNIALSNGGWALWLVRAASGNVIGNGQSSDNRAICLQSASGYSTSNWRLYRDAILGKLVDRDTGTTITSGGWAMLGVANPDNTNFPELGSGNYVNADAQGNFGFPYLGGATNFTITVGATNYARQTIFQTTNKNITFSLKNRTLRSRVAVGNYNGTLANVPLAPAADDDANPNPTVQANCTADTANVGCEGNVRVGVMLGAMGYEDIYNLSLENLIGPTERMNIRASTGTCNVNLTTMSMDILPSNIIAPYQNEYPLSALGYNNAALRVSKYEWWIPAPQNTSNVTVSNIWGLIPRSALESLLTGTIAGGPVSVASLVTTINPQCTGWRRNITTGGANLQGQTFTIDRNNNLTPLRLTLSNMPTTATTTYSRSIIGIMGVEFASNPIYQRVTAISIAGNTTNTSGAANILMPSSSQSLDTDASLVPIVLVADLDKNANTWDQSAVVAIADRVAGRQTYSNTTINTFFSIPSLTWSTINANNRRVAHTNVERNIGGGGGSPWVDVGVGVMSKSSFINTITEETASCGAGAGCCDRQDASNRCQFDQEGSENLWEFFARGRPNASTAPVTDWTIPDLPASVDLQVGNPTNYPDGNYPSLTVVAAAWCPGSSLCTANATSNEFGFDTNGSLNDALNNTTHFATNKLNLGGVRIINPPNQYAAGAAGNVTVNGFVDAGNWDVVSCDRVYVETWQTWTDGTSTGEECGTCPTNTACGSTVVNANCPATHCCSNTTAMTALTAGGGCSAALPPYCFTLPVYISANRWRHIEISPRLGGAYANTCGQSSDEWYFKQGNP